MIIYAPPDRAGAALRPSKKVLQTRRV